MDGKIKIFCIGINKTGTTSIGDALKILGYRRLGWWPKLSVPLVFSWHEGKIDPFIAASKKYDAFEDIPWCFMYKEMSDIYPDAKFILTTRKSSETWHRSIVNHIANANGKKWVGNYLVYSSYDPIIDKELYVNKYETHNSEVRAFFADKQNRFLEMSFERGDGWEKLCNFIEIKDIPSVEFPHSNKTIKDQSNIY